MKYAFYDFSVSPYSYDFVQFLVCAKAAGAETVVFVPGQRTYQKCTPDEQAYRFANLLLPLCKNPIICNDREHAKALCDEDYRINGGTFPNGYTVEKPIFSHMLWDVMRAPKIYPLKADGALMEQAKADFPGKVVTITMRNSRIKPARNSDAVEWLKVAAWLETQGFTPVFIGDSEQPERYGDFAVSKKAQIDVNYRMALYSIAEQNLCVANGPPMLCFLSARPMLMFKPLTEGFWEASTEYWTKCSIPPGAQAPWFNDNQRIVWADDKAEIIIQTLEKWQKVVAKQDQWELPIAPKYPIYGVGSNDDRHKQMETALDAAKKHGFGRLKRRDKFNDRKLTIVCYGPSLKDTWQEIEHPIMTVSGAHDFLVSKGVIPDFHVDCDPREHKIKMLNNPQKATKYVMASCCHPSAWDKLKDYNVKLWHLLNGEETDKYMRQNHPDISPIDFIGGGSTVGMRALEVAGAMGFRRFAIHGMDCSFSADGHHAGEHAGKVQNEIRVAVGKGGPEFVTSPQMKEAAQEMEKFVLTYDVELQFYGNGMLQCMINNLKQSFTDRFNVQQNVRKVA